jgi:hypothetical protein
MIDTLVQAFPDHAEADRRKRALSAMSEMVENLVLARAVNAPSLSEEIVAATAARLGEGSR